MTPERKLLERLVAWDDDKMPRILPGGDVCGGPLFDDPDGIGRILTDARALLALPEPVMAKMAHVLFWEIDGVWWAHPGSGITTVRVPVPQFYLNPPVIQGEVIP